jgi:hypothetical protein
VEEGINMNINRENRRSAVALIVVAVTFLLAPNTSAQRQQGEIVAAGDEVTILITAHPHNDRARNRRQTPSR